GLPLQLKRLLLLGFFGSVLGLVGHVLSLLSHVGSGVGSVVGGSAGGGASGVGSGVGSSSGRVSGDLGGVSSLGALGGSGVGSSLGLGSGGVSGSGRVLRLLGVRACGQGQTQGQGDQQLVDAHVGCSSSLVGQRATARRQHDDKPVSTVKRKQVSFVKGS